MITLQCVQMLNRYIVHLKPMGCCMSIILQLKKKKEHVVMNSEPLILEIRK